jgi:hypothetical protein
MVKAKDDHKERVGRATEIKNSITKTFTAVCDSNGVLQVLLAGGDSQLMLPLPSASRGR